MTDDEWVKKLNALSQEMDEWAGSVHPSMAMDITSELRKKFRALAQSASGASRLNERLDRHG